jgi:hypothetical protein
MLPGEQQFRIVIRNCGGTNDDIGTFQVRAAVADADVYTQSLQALGHCTRPGIGSGYSITLIEQHLRDPAHAGTTDTNEMNLANAPHFRHLKRAW